MGARAPSDERPRRGGLKCEFCGRPAVSAQALQAHQATLHSQALKEKTRRSMSSTPTPKTQKTEPRRVVAKKSTTKPALPETVTKELTEKKSPIVAKPKSKQTNSKPEMDKPSNTNGTEPPKPQEVPKQTKLRKIEHQCPKCEKSFAVRFVAIKHIQKYHCVNKAGQEVPPDSPDLIQPILYELCLRCNIKCPTPHDCPLRPKPVWYECSECHQKFKNTVLFTKHIEEEHESQIQRMYFPNEEEFTAWKKQMEEETECSYVIMQKVQRKQIYYCSEFMESQSEGHPRFCPSTIITLTGLTSKGMDVSFYPNHYGHKHKKYSLADEDKLFPLSDSTVHTDPIKDSSESEDIYIQFKTLMDNIVLDSAKINISTLQVLLGKAREMNAIINNYSEDDDFDTGSSPSIRSMNTISMFIPKEISEVTEPVKTRKRSIEENGVPLVPAKKKKVPPKKQNTLSLADDKDVEKILKELEQPNKLNTVRKSLKSPSSFNDSYKEFIDKNKTLNKTAKPAPKKRNVVKTKMGIFKPGSSPKTEDKSDNSPSPKKLVKSDSSSSPKKLVKSDSSSSPKKLIKSDSSSSPKKLIKSDSTSSPKKLIKSVSSPPKKAVKRDRSVSPQNVVTRHSFSKTKDIEYEVREQENDCNILVLKI